MFRVAQWFFLIYIVMLLCVQLSKANTNELADKLSGQTVGLYCVKNLPYEGVTYFTRSGDGPWQNDGGIFINKPLCKGLFLLDQHKWPTDTAKQYLMASGIMTLVHESYHISLNSTDEGLVECMAYRNVWNVLKSFGYSSYHNKILWSIIKWEHNTQLPAEYRTVC